MSYQNWDDVDEGNDVEEETREVNWGGRDGVIFLIDATESMFREDEPQQNRDSEIFFRKALRCCKMFMLKKVMGSEKDLIGVVLFGTAQKQNHLDLNHLYVLQSLEQPNVGKIKDLDKMIKSDSCDYFDAKYGHSDKYILQDVLWLCQSIFANCEQKMGMQRILLFTANDNPHSGNQIEQQRAIDRAIDLNELNISLELLPMGSVFDKSLLYKDLVEAAMGEDYAEQALGRCAENIEELLLRVCRYNHKKRSQGRRLMYLGSKLAIGVGIYSMLRRRPMPKRIWLESKTNLQIKPTTHQFDANSGEVILPMDIMKYKYYGGQKVVFKPEETKLTTNIMEPGFYVMGFKPKETVKLQYHMSKPYFIFPDENQVKGSRKFFAALLERCAQREKIIICWGVLRQGSPPKLFAFFPQLEVLNPETGVQEVPGGFLAFPLPLSGNIRKIEAETTLKPTESQLEFMRKLVTKLTFRYNVHNFQNPSLQTLWAGIEALALEMPKPREIEDNTKPKYELIDRKIKELGVDYDELFCTKDSDVSLSNFGKSAAKRGGRPKGSAGARKSENVKQSKFEYMDIQELARSGKVATLNVNQLKAFLVRQGQVVSRKRKADLVDMVYMELDIDPPLS